MRGRELEIRAEHKGREVWAEANHRTDSHARTWLASLRSVPTFSGRACVRARVGGEPRLAPDPHAEGGDPATLPGGAAGVAGRCVGLLALLRRLRESSRAGRRARVGQRTDPVRCPGLVVSGATWLNRVSFARDRVPPPSSPARHGTTADEVIVDGREVEGTREGGRLMRVFQIQKTGGVEGAVCCLLAQVGQGRATVGSLAPSAGLRPLRAVLPRSTCLVCSSCSRFLAVTCNACALLLLPTGELGRGVLVCAPRCPLRCFYISSYIRELGKLLDCTGSLHSRFQIMMICYMKL